MLSETPKKTHWALALEKGIRETTRGKEKILMTLVGKEPTTSGLDLPLLSRSTKLRGRTEKVRDDSYDLTLMS